MSMLGDVLRKNLYQLQNASKKKTDKDAFWIILRDIAVEEIIKNGFPIDSDVIIPIYYEILSENLSYIPPYFQERLKSNHQERFRVLIRNLFSSNAFHKEGLANQPSIFAYTQVNEFKKGSRIVYQKK